VPHPLVRDFVRASVDNRRLRETRPADVTPAAVEP
jgi:hypothetical protein